MNSIVSVDTSYLDIALSVVLPMIVALITKQFAETWVKAIALLVLSALTATVTDMLSHGGTFVLGPTIGEFILTFVIATGLHYGLLKPIGVTGSSGAIAKVFPGGIGTARLLP
jgi:hypothetical protein